MSRNRSRIRRGSVSHEQLTADLFNLISHMQVIDAEAQRRSQRNPATPDDIERENAMERVRQSGPGMELLRRACVRRLRAYTESLLAHGSVADLFVLSAAFEDMEARLSDQPALSPHQAALTEAMLMKLGLKPDKLVGTGDEDTL